MRARQNLNGISNREGPPIHENSNLPYWEEKYSHITHEAERKYNRKYESKEQRKSNCGHKPSRRTPIRGNTREWHSPHDQSGKEQRTDQGTRHPDFWEPGVPAFPNLGKEDLQSRGFPHNLGLGGGGIGCPVPLRGNPHRACFMSSFSHGRFRGRKGIQALIKSTRVGCGRSWTVGMGFKPAPTCILIFWGEGHLIEFSLQD